MHPQPSKLEAILRLSRVSSLLGISLGMLMIGFAGFAARAACDLQLVTAGPCHPDSTSGTPYVGEGYGIKITANVKGTPSHSFRIRFTMADFTNYLENINLGAGNGYWWWYWWNVDLDDAIPWSVTLDPDGLTGDTNLANNTISGTFTPIPPTNPVDLYSPRLLQGSESYKLEFQPGSGTIGRIHVLFGMPTSHGAQRAISVSPPTNGTTVITAPYNIPVHEISRTNVPAGVLQDTNYFTVQLSRIRVNPSLLRTNTWDGMTQLTTNWTQWLAPDQRVQSTNVLITNFVTQSLPVNYKAILTPYDTARTLHRAVMKKLVYQSPPDHLDAVGVLQDGYADCGGFAALLTACLRQVGIPARSVCGFFEGDSVWHCRVEFHLPGVEWLVADPTFGRAADPSGTYAFYFGYVPNADTYLAVDAGDSHIFPYHDFEFIQVPNWWWFGGATFQSYSCSAQLHGVCALWPSNVVNGTSSFYVSDVPSQGNIIIEKSSNLTNWLAVSTNAAAGNPISMSFSTTNSRGFYRAKLSP